MREAGMPVELKSRRCIVLSEKKPREYAGIQVCGRTVPEKHVMVPPEDADMIRKVHRILKAGKNVEIRQDTRGNTKVFRVSKEIE